MKHRFQYWSNFFFKVVQLFPLKKINILVIFFLLTLSTIIELIGLSMIIPFVSSLIQKNNINFDYEKFQIFKLIGIQNLDTSFIVVLLIIIFSIKILLSILTEGLILNLTFKSRALLRSKMTKLYLSTDYSMISKDSSASLINSIQSFCSQHRSAVLHFLKLFGDLIFISFVFIFLIFKYDFYAFYSLGIV